MIRGLFHQDHRYRDNEDCVGRANVVGTQKTRQYIEPHLNPKETFCVVCFCLHGPPPLRTCLSFPTSCLPLLFPSDLVAPGALYTQRKRRVGCPATEEPTLGRRHSKAMWAMSGRFVVRPGGAWWPYGYAMCSACGGAETNVQLSLRATAAVLSNDAKFCFWSSAWLSCLGMVVQYALFATSR